MGGSRCLVPGRRNGVGGVTMSGWLTRDCRGAAGAHPGRILLLIVAGGSEWWCALARCSWPVRCHAYGIMLQGPRSVACRDRDVADWAGTVDPPYQPTRRVPWSRVGVLSRGLDEHPWLPH